MSTVRISYLGAKLSALLEPEGRYSPPRHMGERAQAEEMAALVRALDREAPRDGYESWWPRFEDRLVEALKTRTWPTVGDLVRVAKDMPRPERALGEEPEHIYPMVVEWWHRFHDAFPSVAKEHHAARLVADGHATYGELHRACFPLPASAREHWIGDRGEPPPAPRFKRMPNERTEAEHERLRAAAARDDFA